MFLRLLRTQIRRMGLVSVLPLGAGAAVAIASLVADAVWPTSQAMTVASWLAQVYVICAGICVASAVTGDPIIELHESTPATFRHVQAIRASLVVGSAGAGACVMYAPLHLAGIWPGDVGWVSVLSPLGAVVVVAAVAFTTAAFAGTVSATTLTVIASWMFLSMLWDPYVLPLHLQRGLPLLGAVAIALLAWRRLGNSEANITKAVAS